MSVSLPFLNAEHYICGDTPLLFRRVTDVPHLYVDWGDVQHCLNNPWMYNIEILDSNNTKVQMPTVPHPWHGNWHPDKKVIMDLVNDNHTFVIAKYGHHNKAVNELLQSIENAFDVACDAHIYGALGGASSFKIHWDQPANFIMQIHGETHWTVYNERCSTLVKYTGFPYNPTEDEVTPAIDTVLQPGDMLYIPSRCYHCARPDQERLSLSIPCWHDPENKPDRNQYILDIT